MFELYERFPKNVKDMLTLRQYVYSSTELIFYHYVNLLLLLMASFRYFASKKWNSYLIM